MKFTDGPGHAPVVIGVVIGVDSLLVFDVETAGHGLFLVVGLDRFLSGDDFFHKAVEFSELERAFAEKRTHLAGHIPGKKDGNGDRHGEDENQHRRYGQHHHKGSHHGDSTGRYLEKIVGKGGVDRVDVVGDAADDVAGLMAVEIPHRQFHKAAEDILPHLENHFLAQSDHQNRKNIGQQGREQIKRDHQPAVIEHHGEIHPAGRRADGVDGPSRQGGTDQGEEVAGDRQQKGGQHHPFEAVQISPQTDQDLLAVLRLFRDSTGTLRQPRHLPSATG